MIEIIQYNETHMKIIVNDWGVEQELSEAFTFYAAGYKFMPSYRNGMWDGKIRLLDQRKKTMYKGLLAQVFAWSKKNGYPIKIDPNLANTTDVTFEQVEEFVNGLNLQSKGESITPHEYQIDAIHNSLKQNRSLMLSPTSSGKSMMIYSYMRWHLEKEKNLLIVVPTTMLVEQLYSDFVDYSTANGFVVEDNIQVLYSGKDRAFTKPVVISTWQSIASMMKSDAANFQSIVERTDVAIWDEAHTYKAAAVLGVMEKFIFTKYRLGTTGTIDDSKINSLTLNGLMGPIYKVISTAELMAAGKVSPLEIKCLVLKYPEYVRKAMKGMDYKEEVSFLIANDVRNKFIADLAVNCEGNTLVLFNFVERHGSVLYSMVKAQTDRPVYYIHGGVDNEERERIRKIVETQDNAIMLATSSLMSTGTNIPSIRNIIFAIPSKSTIRVRQSIGRGLRLKKGKDKCVLFDISDDLKYKAYTNTTWKHMEDRLAIYSKEAFSFAIRELQLPYKTQ